jgi:hypothetical protein
LLFPENNTECIEGTILSDTESKVAFTWKASENTDAYTVNLKNLDSSTSQSLNASTNELEITLTRGTPYSWSVTSKANGISETAESPIWKFYNAGRAIENYAPFPAEAVSPKMGSSIDAGTIIISWQGNDVDNDIVSYDIYIDENNPPTTLANSPTSDSINYEVLSSKVYYWKVITKDASGNTSSSEVFQFKVN